MVFEVDVNALCVWLVVELEANVPRRRKMAEGFSLDNLDVNGL